MIILLHITCTVLIFVLSYFVWKNIALESEIKILRAKLVRSSIKEVAKQHFTPEINRIPSKERKFAVCGGQHHQYN